VCFKNNLLKTESFINHKIKSISNYFPAIFQLYPNYSQFHSRALLVFYAFDILLIMETCLSCFLLQEKIVVRNGNSCVEAGTKMLKVAKKKHVGSSWEQPRDSLQWETDWLKEACQGKTIRGVSRFFEKLSDFCDVLQPI